jgi:REP element-mobilizing transposase RayT
MMIETGASSADEIDQLEDDEDESVIAAIAVQLTQFSLESSAQATIISRSGQRLAEAGNLPDAAMDRLFDLVDRAWQSATSDALIRFITLPEAGEFLLYSAQVEHDLILSMVFHSAIPVRTIRKQARRLSESLELVPEEIEPPAARTLPSRPTDMKPPPGWDKTVEDKAVEEQAAVAEESVPARPEPEEEVVYAAYTAMWLPADPTLELLDDLADGLAAWIEDIAADSAWELDDLAVFPDYVLVALRAPQTILPDDAIMRLMDETARLSQEAFPEVANGGPLWTDGYYVVSPSRELSEREVARFITYQRQAQLG